MPADTLPTFDLSTIATLIGIGIGTAVTVVVAYKKTFKDEPAVTKSGDVVIPSLSIASLKPIEEGMRNIAASIDSVHASMKRWREDDQDERMILQREKSAELRGAERERERLRLEQEEGRRRDRRRPDAL